MIMYTEEDDVIRNAIEEAVCEGEDGDRVVQSQVGGERSQGSHEAANYEAPPVTQQRNNDQAAWRVNDTLGKG